MSDIEIDATTLVRFVYIVNDGQDDIVITCNYCHNHEFFRGPDTSTPDSDWLTEAATHVSMVHKGKPIYAT